jgi:hypothetical protein
VADHPIPRLLDQISELDVPAFDDGTSTNQWLLGCDVLWEF